MEGKMKQAGKIFFAAFVFFCVAGVARVYAADTAPTVDKTSVFVHVMQRSDKWLPEMDFKVNGPISAGTSFTVNYTLPGGKPWITLNLTSEEQCADCYYAYKDIGSGDSIADSKATAEVGNFGLEITMANELEGTKGALYDGTFTVKKFKSENGEVNHYVDQDWRLPVGFVGGEWLEQSYGTMQQNQAPYLTAKSWFKGGNDPQAQAFLFFGGKKIGDPANVTSCNSVSTYNTSTMNYYCLKFHFSNVKWWLMPEVAQNFPDAYVLYGNAGEYQIKILRDGKLSRVITFSVTADGKMVDNGYAAQAGYRYNWIVPVQVSGDGDGTWDKAAYKTGAFYGNPLSGFTAP